MGMSMRSKSASTYEKKCDCKKEAPPNPDPRDFVIKVLRPFGDRIVALVNYPACTTFEGNKVLVFQGLSVTEITNMKVVDPHFYPNEVSPIARFQPTDEGWNNAIEFCLMKDSEISP